MPWYKVFVFQCTLQPEQFYLLVNASGISRQAAIRAHHAVAGDDNGNLVFAHSAAHRLCRHPGQSPFCGHLPGNITIGTGLAVWDGSQNCPDLILEVGAGKMHGRCEIRIPAGKVNIQPLFCLLKHRQVFFFMFLVQIEREVFLPLKP